MLSKNRISKVTTIYSFREDPHSILDKVLDDQRRAVRNYAVWETEVEVGAPYRSLDLSSSQKDPYLAAVFGECP